MDSLVSLTRKNLSDIVFQAITLKPTERVVIIFDTQAPLTRIILDAYRDVLAQAEFIDIDKTTPEEVKHAIFSCQPGDLVILLQSTNFRLDEFRFRIELFKRELKTIEHVHLARIREDQFANYIHALAFDRDYYQTQGKGIKKMLDHAQKIVVECAGTTLLYSGGMEQAKLNIGDYTGMKNVGGTYPIGEVFTEARDLTTVNGDAMIFAYAGNDHLVRIVEPFKVIIAKGILTASDAPQEFQELLDIIRLDEDVTVREFGLGLNPAMGKHALVSDITAFERQKGLRLSLGAKHTVYNKPGMNRKKGRYHIDIFVDLQKITADGKMLYNDQTFFVHDCL